jgi:hypothetical protein
MFYAFLQSNFRLFSKTYEFGKDILWRIFRGSEEKECGNFFSVFEGLNPQAII